LNYCRSYYTHQLHMVGCCIPPPIVLLCYHRRSSIPIGASQSALALWHFIQDSKLHFYRCSSSGMGTSRPRSGAPLFHFSLFTSRPFGDAQYRWAAPWERHTMASICAPQFHSAPLHHHQHFSCPPYTRHQALLLSWWRTSFASEFLILPFKLHFDSLRASLSIPNL
jgi:hypothetical protein